MLSHIDVGFPGKENEKNEKNQKFVPRKEISYQLVFIITCIFSFVYT